MTQLSAEELTLTYETNTIINGINLNIPKGKVTIIIGANGCGKSTILHALGRLMKPKQGSVYLNGKNIHQYSPKEVAKQLAFLAQSPEILEDLTVEELCLYGRHPHKSLFARHSDKDKAVVEEALKATKMDLLKDRTLDALSGGQRQRAWIAMALAQETDVLLLDEPTTYLDLAHQIEVLELLRALNQKHKNTIIMVLHDLNQAASYADYLISIVDGEIYQEGTPNDIFTEEMIQHVFGLNSKIIESPVNQAPICIPMGVI